MSVDGATGILTPQLALIVPPKVAAVVMDRVEAALYCEDDPYTPTGQRDEVALDVEAVHAETGGRRIFTVYDYPDFIITDDEAVAFFKHFTSDVLHS